MVLILAIGFTVVIPLVVPALLLLIPSFFNPRNREFWESLELTQYTEPILWIFALNAGYVFLNLSLKAIRGSIKKQKA